jgi:hypothetical protein
VISVTVTQKGVKQAELRLKNFSHDASAPGQVRVMQRATAIMETDLKTVALDGVKGRHPFFGVTSGPTLGALGVRSGHLRRSVVSDVIHKASYPPVLIGVTGTPSKIAAIHEEGAHIQGRPLLAIPLAAAQTMAGVMRQSPRSYANAFVFKSKKGNLFLAINRGGQLVPLFILKQTVHLRARHVFKRSLKRCKRAIEALFDVDVALKARKANGGV